MIENVTLAGSERSKPTSELSRMPSPFGEKYARLGGEAHARARNSLLSCCVTKKAAMVATASSANTTRTRGRVIGAGRLSKRCAAGRAGRFRPPQCIGCACSSSTPPGTCSPTTTPSRARSRAGAPRSSWSPRASCTAPPPAPDGYAVSEPFYRLATRYAADAPRPAARAEARRARAGHAALPAPRRRARTCATSSGCRSSDSTRRLLPRRPPARADDAQRDPARGARPAARRADGRRDRAHPARRGAARRRASACT